MVCWIHKWKYDLEYRDAIARTCVKCHRHEVDEVSYDMFPPVFEGFKRVSCCEYEQWISDKKEEKKKERASRRKELNRLKPRQDCKWW